MKAILVRAAGGPEVLELTEQPLPSPGAGEVRVKIAAIGVNYADVMCRKAIHLSMRPPPIIPGCEAAGIIDACGAGVSPHRLGERVGVYSPFGGAYAQSMTVPEAYALPLPQQMAFDEAAAFTHVFLTAHFALFGYGTPEPGSSVLITAAAGGLGGALRQVAHASKLDVIAAVGSEVKRRKLLESGERTVLAYEAASLTDQVLSVTSGRGVDLAIETVGGKVFDQAQAALAPLGRIVIAGVASGEESRPDIPTLLARSAACATLNLSVVFANRPQAVRDAWNRLIEGYLSEALRPQIGTRYALSEVASAHRLMESRASIGKILLDPDGPTADAVPITADTMPATAHRA
jgi:NADPH:quinone reductase